MQSTGQVCWIYSCVNWNRISYWLKVTIQTDDMELAGNIVQSIGKFLNISDLQTTADFPRELEILQQVYSQVEISFEE